MDDATVAILFLIISVVGWLWQKTREGSKQEQESKKPELTLEDIFVDVSELEMEIGSGSEMSERMDSEALDMEESVDSGVPGKGESVDSTPVRPQSDAQPQPQTASARGTAEKPERTIAGIPINPRGIRQGIIISEVLGKPKSLR